jgi:hypothetical protein
MRDPCSHISRLDIIAAKLHGASSEDLHAAIQGHLAHECDDRPVWDQPSTPEYA